MDHADIDHTGLTGIAGTPVCGIATKNSAFTTNSTSMVDVTGQSVTITTLARRVLLLWTGTVSIDTNGHVVYLTFSVDGTDVEAGGYWQGSMIRTGTANDNVVVTLSYLTPVQTAASHTYKLRMAADGGGATAKINASAGGIVQLTAQETMFTA